MPTNNSSTKYLNIADIKEHWLNVIAPNYFDFSNVNNYQAGIFGYVNEVMGEAVEDAFNAVNIARREFYPVTAEYLSSLYKMATLQQIDIPLTVPSTCRAALVLSQSEVISNSTYEDGIYTCVIDSCLNILANNIPFMLDYPIVILTKKTSSGWSHTAHYDTTIKNSLNTQSDVGYISNKVLRSDGVNYLVLFINTLRQVTMTREPYVIVKDSILDTVSLEVNWTGNLANFEVFYTANSQTPPVQLQKVLINGTVPNVPFCYYEYISNTKMRLTFPAGTSFVPEFNSEIEVLLYTSMGSEGNFESFDGDLVCTSDSEDYPYNSTMTITGLVNGSASGGRDQILNEQFRTQIIKAYSTNNTITTSNDLQIYFDDLASNLENLKVLFKKKRDDAFIRLFGAYVLMKDRLDNVIPSNTLKAVFKKSDIMDVDSVDNRVVIRPGTTFIYQYPESATDFTAIIGSLADGNVPIPPGNYYLTNLGEVYRLLDGNMVEVPGTSNITTYASTHIQPRVLTGLARSPDEEGFLFTNPFLIVINLNPNSIGYYLNTISETKPIEYTYMNDDTTSQFMANNLKIERNAMKGSNFYKLSISITPANAEIDVNTVISENPFSSETNEETGEMTVTNGIRAKMNGSVISQTFVCEPILTGVENGIGVFTDQEYCFVKTIIEYEDKSQEIIVSSNVVSDDPNIATGYKMNFNVGDSFLKDDILASKYVTDLGKLKLIGDINQSLYVNGMYIPFVIEEVDTSSGDSPIFKCSAYLSTNDMIDNNANVEIMNGIYNSDGTPNTNVAMTIQNLDFEIHAMYKNDDINFPNKYTNYPWVAGYTMCNTYSTTDDSPISLYEPITFIRSVIDYYPITGDSQEGDYGITIDEVPLLSYDWAQDPDNFVQFVSKIRSIYGILQQAYYNLENNFAIDLKFYNTYGKARFYKVGLATANTSLNNVSVSFRFGVRLNVVASTDSFIDKFRNYIKEYIENMDDVTSEGQDTYILNMVSDIKANMSEIAYIVYYGFNVYDHEAQKIVGPDLDSYQEDFIPEFINIQIAYDADGEPYPDIEVDILNS